MVNVKNSTFINQNIPLPWAAEMTYYAKRIKDGDRRVRTIYPLLF